eukprot:3876911-Ditylum_brightwellii.AAC.1
MGREHIIQIILWIHEFQLCVNDIIGGNFIQFAAELWDPPDDNGNSPPMEEEDKVDMPLEEWEKWEEKVTV